LIACSLAAGRLPALAAAAESAETGCGAAALLHPAENRAAAIVHDSPLSAKIFGLSL